MSERCQTCGEVVSSSLCSLYPHGGELFGAQPSPLFTMVMCSLCLTSEEKVRKAIEVYYFLQRLGTIHSSSPNNTPVSDLITHTFKVTLLNAIFGISTTSSESNHLTSTTPLPHFRLAGSQEIHDHLLPSPSTPPRSPSSPSTPSPSSPSSSSITQPTIPNTGTPYRHDDFLTIPVDEDNDDDDSSASCSEEDMLEDWMENVRIQERLLFSDENYIPVYCGSYKIKDSLFG